MLLNHRLRVFFGSRACFNLIFVLLIIEALWIALTARYPQAFDEQFHFGLIQLHAQQWLPFFNHQPASADAYGAVVRDPSYLYHYFLSFPYRLIQVFTQNETIQVIILRCLNILLFASSLPLFRRVGLRLGMSKASIHSTLLIFVLLPVVPLLASQINYYNMIVPLTALLALLLLRFQRQMQSSAQFPSATIWSIVIVGLLGSVVHYPFLPLVVIAFVYVLVVVLRRRPNWPILHWNIRLVGAIILLLISLGLFSERYAVNLVRYHSPTPECDQVLSIKECQQYSPWLRNYYFAAQNAHPKTKNIIMYPFTWIDRVITETTFAIGSGFNSGIDTSKHQYGQVDYWQALPLPVPRLLTIGVLIGGLGAMLISVRRLLVNKPLRLVLGLTFGLTVALFLLNLSDYLRVGDIVGVHGRYLVPVMPFLLMAIALAFHRLVRIKQLPVLFAIILIVFALQGGGITTYIVRSQSRWFWPQSSIARTINARVQSILWPITIGSKSG